MMSLLRSFLTVRFFIAAAACLGCMAAGLAQDGVLMKEAYLRPPAEVTDVVLAPRHLNVSLSNLSPDGEFFLITRSGGMPSLATYAKRYYNLGGWQIDPLANRSRRFTLRGSTGLELFSWKSGRRIKVETPDGATISRPVWSPDGSRLAFFANFVIDTHIYVADTADGTSRRITKTPVLATMVTSIEWTGDSRHILTVLQPENRGDEPKQEEVPSEPKVLLTADAKNQLRTYPSLLETPHEKALVEYYSTGQLSLLDVIGGDVRAIGKPAMIRSINAAPDGQYFRITTVQKPFSYIVPVSNFGSVEEI